LVKTQTSWDRTCSFNGCTSYFAMHPGEQSRSLLGMYVPRPTSTTSFDNTACVVASLPFLEFRGCFLIKADNILWASFAAVAVVESGKFCGPLDVLIILQTHSFVVVLILMVISAVSFCSSTTWPSSALGSSFVLATCRSTRLRQ
jgi:hypothetical protein